MPNHTFHRNVATQLANKLRGYAVAGVVFDVTLGHDHYSLEDIAGQLQAADELIQHLEMSAAVARKTLLDTAPGAANDDKAHQLLREVIDSMLNSIGAGRPS